MSIQSSLNRISRYSQDIVWVMYSADSKVRRYWISFLIYWSVLFTTVGLAIKDGIFQSGTLLVRFAEVVHGVLLGYLGVLLLLSSIGLILFGWGSEPSKSVIKKFGKDYPDLEDGVKDGGNVRVVDGMLPTTENPPEEVPTMYDESRPFSKREDLTITRKYEKEDIQRLEKLIREFK